MGYSPKKPKNSKKAKEVNMRFHDLETAKLLSPHTHILLLRKSAAKLKQFMDCFITTQYPASKLIEIKYHFSKCRPEVLAMMESMAKDPKRFEFSSLDDNRKVLVDTVTDTSFQLYSFTPPKLYINSREFLTAIELECVSKVIESLAIMSMNEYKLQEELKTLEEQKNVFEIYKSEKLASK